MKKLLATTALIALGACSMQEPASVISGFGNKGYRVVDTRTAVDISGEEMADVSSVETPNMQVEASGTSEGGFRGYRVIEPAAGAMASTPVVTSSTPSVYRLTDSVVAKNSAANAVAQANDAVTALNQQRYSRASMDDVFSMKPAAGPVAPKAPVVSAPSRATAPTMASKPSAKADTYMVMKGDTLYSLSKRFGTTVGTLMNDNKLTSAQQLTAGDIIMIPASSKASVAKPAPTMTAMKKASMSTIEPAAGTVASTSVQAAAGVNYVTHSVQKGENLYRIGLQYKVSVIDLMAANDLSVPQDLKSGMTIRVPLTSNQPAVVRQSTSVNRVAAQAKGMVWPAKGAIISSFGQKGNGVTHTGVAIKLPENTPIMAAEKGTVIYADNGLKSYGNLVLVRHSDGLVTAYAHNKTLSVKKGQVVKKGQTIAMSGASGNVSVPQLHFEVRRNARAIDPMKVLPKI